MRTPSHEDMSCGWSRPAKRPIGNTQRAIGQAMAISPGSGGILNSTLVGTRYLKQLSKLFLSLSLSLLSSLSIWFQGLLSETALGSHRFTRP